MNRVRTRYRPGKISSVNLIPNSAASGASAGVLPTGWLTGSLVNSTVTSVGRGEENGLPYWEVTVATSAAGSGRVQFATTNPTVPGSTIVVGSAYVKRVSGAFTNFSIFRLRMVQNSGSAIYGSQSVTAASTGDLNTQRFSLSGTTAAGTTDTRFEFDWTSTGVASVTLRIAVPQLELRSTPTNPIIQG
jgi:hypothetical protein